MAATPQPFDSFAELAFKQLPARKSALPVLVNYGRGRMLKYLLANRNPNIAMGDDQEEKQRILLKETYEKAPIVHPEEAGDAARRDMETMKRTIIPLLGKPERKSVVTVPYQDFVKQIIAKVADRDIENEIFPGRIEMAREEAIQHILASQTPGIVMSTAMEKFQSDMLQNEYEHSGYGDQTASARFAREDMDAMKRGVDTFLGTSPGAAVAAV